MKQEKTKVKSKKSTYWKSYSKKIIETLCVNAFVVFSIVFFAPMETYLSNMGDFMFGFNHVWWILLSVSVVLTAVSAAAESFLPKSFLRPINLFIFASGLCFYIQSLFLNGHMGTMLGERDVYNTSLKISNLVIWLIIYAVVFASYFAAVKMSKKQIAEGAVKFVSIILVIMQLTGLVSLALTADYSADRVKFNYLSDDGQFELSAENNVVYFILDTAQQYQVEEALQRYPDMFDNFTGFTYYPNMTSTHSRTYPSIQYLLTEKICYYNKPATEYITDAHENGTFLYDMDELGTDIRLGASNNAVAEPVMGIVDNYMVRDNSTIDSINIREAIVLSIKIAAYRGAPYIIKDRFYYTSAIINERVVTAIESRVITENDVRFFKELKEERVTVSTEYSSAFRFYHMDGVHYGNDLDEKANVLPGADRIQTLRGCMYILEEYIAQLKENGIYDKTTIIITADHGVSIAMPDTGLVHAPTCLMMIKPAGADSNAPVKISNAPVCHEDIFPTVISALGGDSSSYGRTIFEIEENEERERYYYHTIFTEDGDGEMFLREYVVNGDATDIENWETTGRNWKVVYSWNDVSKMDIDDYIDGELCEAPIS